ncbi:GspH/FimT family pseudopilin [Marinomonas posidonica]|uniref:GspH/FimT family pseudopilin n=1 Tax=Marinomonas posidonica TaxID=936476 RepID=UPI0037357735
MVQQCGYSLLELLCVLAILSLLAHLGSSHFLSVNQDLENQRTLKTEVARLANGLTQARQLAVASGRLSYLCGGIRHCTGDWSAGFRVYQHTESGETEKTFASMPFASGLLVAWRGFPAQKTQIEYRLNGLSGYQNGTFVFCLGRWKMALVLNQSGRFYVSSLQPQTASLNVGDCE